MDQSPKMPSGVLSYVTNAVTGVAVAGETAVVRTVRSAPSSFTSVPSNTTLGTYVLKILARFTTASSQRRPFTDGGQPDWSRPRARSRPWRLTTSRDLPQTDWSA